MTPGNLHDSEGLSLQLLKKGKSLITNHFTTAILDVGYDYESIYRQAYHQSMRVVVPYTIRYEDEFIGLDKHFRLTFLREHSYCYDSFDEKYLKSNVKQIFKNIHNHPAVSKFGRMHIKNE